MAKYRRKGATVEAIYAPKGYYFDRPETGGRYALVREDGVLLVLSKASFEHDYELAVEEKALWGRCIQCGHAFALGETWDTGPSGFKHCYPECWAVDRLTTKKPRPLTLGGLTPGDVFCWVGVGENEHWPKQRLSATEYYSQHNDRIYSGNETVCVRFSSHHDLTRRQLLWIAATPEERKALVDSIRGKWMPIMRGEKRDEGAGDCPCCRLHHGDCTFCLINRAEPSAAECGAGRYRSAAEGNYQDKRAFALWLAEFLPNISPPRLEVESTPIEWPGPRK